MKFPLPTKIHSLALLLTLSFLCFAESAKAAQSSLLKSFPPLFFPNNAQPYSTNLTNYFTTPMGTNMVRVISSLSDTNGIPLGFTLQLFPSNAPQTVANFLAYVNDGAYENTLIHRSLPGFVIQTGGYTDGGTGSTWNSPIATFSNTVPSESSNGLSNTLGTVSMALVGSDSNSATDQWFVNLADNRSILDKTNNAGNPPFTVFAQVIGNGMKAINAIAGLTTYADIVTSSNPVYPLGSWLNQYIGFNSNSPFYDMPLSGITTNSTTLQLNNLVTLTHVSTNPLYAVSNDTNYYSALVSNSILSISFTGGTNPPAPITITVYSSDTNGVSTGSFEVWNQTNVVPKVSYITQIPYSTNSIFNYLYYPALPDGTRITNVTFGWTPGLLNTNNNYAISGTGTLTLTAKSSATFFYQASTNVFQIKIAKLQNITFPALTTNPSNSITFTTNPIVLKATSDSSLPVSYTLANNSPAKISGSSLTLTGVGIVGVIASQSGNSTYLAANPITNSLIVTLASQTITFPTIPNQNIPVTAPVPLKASSSSGLPIGYRVVSGGGFITNNSVVVTNHGTISVAAYQSGNGNYNPATSVTNSFDAKLTQTLTPLATIPAKTYTNPAASFSVKVPTTSAQSPTATNVVLTATGPATVSNALSNDIVTITGAGTVTLTATQAGDQWYFPASVSTSFIVAKAPQKIAPFATVSTKTNGMAPFPVAIPTINTTNLVTVTASGAGYISGTNGSNVLVALTNAGTVTLTANQAGNSNYLAASAVTQTFSVAKGNQFIVFPTIANQDLGNLVSLSGYTTNSSGSSTRLPITYSVSTIPKNIGYLTNTSKIQTLGQGTITVVASQTGSSGYNAARSVTNSFSVKISP